MKKIIVTGSQGLIAKKVIKFLKKNNYVKGIDIRENLDLTDEIKVKKFFKKNNNFNYLINLHGANEHILKNKTAKKEFLVQKDNFNHYFLNNVFSVYLTNKYFIKYSKKAEGIINFSSIYSVISPKHYIYKEPKDIFYVSSKFAVNGITKYFATKFGQKLNVNTIANHGIEWKQPNNFKKKLLLNIPKKRMLKTEDLFGIIDLLCSNKNTFINGSTIVVDGGYSSW